MAGFTYRLYLENGEDIGSFATGVRDWSVGDEFLNSDFVRFRIVNIVVGIDEVGDEFGGFLVVTPVEIAV